MYATWITSPASRRWSRLASRWLAVVVIVILDGGDPGPG
jgi:hypothetical protein